MKPLKHYKSNTKGLDFIVGDLHGCYTELMDLEVKEELIRSNCGQC